MTVQLADHDVPVLMGQDLVARLRGGSEPRPEVDAGLAGGLRDWLDDELAAVAACLPPGAEPVLVTKERVNQVLICEAHLDVRLGKQQLSFEMVRGIVVDVLFRQWVTSGYMGDPLDDALQAVMAEGTRHDVISFLESMDGTTRARLAEEVAGHVAVITGSWPPFPASWLARTQERLALPLAGGRILLKGTVDLSLGSPSEGAASVCIVEVKSGRRRVEHRGDLQLYALMETLRSGAPPFRIATYYTGTGELDVEPVGREVLHGALHRVVAATTRICRLKAGEEPVPSPNPLCSWCAALPVCAHGQARAGTAVPMETGAAADAGLGKLAVEEEDDTWQ